MMSCTRCRSQGLSFAITSNRTEGLQAKFCSYFFLIKKILSIFSSFHSFSKNKYLKTFSTLSSLSCITDKKLSPNQPRQAWRCVSPCVWGSSSPWWRRVKTITTMAVLLHLSMCIITHRRHYSHNRCINGDPVRSNSRDIGTAGPERRRALASQSETQSETLLVN